MNISSPTSPRSSSRALRVLALALAATLAPLAACGDDTTEDGAGGSGSDDGAGGSTPGCGTVEDPAILTLRDVAPAPASVESADGVVHAFTIVGAPGIIQQLTLQAEATHTAGVPTPNQLTFSVTQAGSDLTYVAAPVSWETAPGHVELTVANAFEVEGCVFAFPSPLFSYDLSAGDGAGGGGQGGAGEGGAGEGGAAE